MEYWRHIGAWRSLVARTVRVGEVPSSNLGAPIKKAPQSRGFFRSSRASGCPRHSAGTRVVPFLDLVSRALGQGGFLRLVFAPPQGGANHAYAERAACR